MHHIPVLLEESLDLLLNDLSGNYLDLTFGRGSHSKSILNKLSSSAKLYAVDRDPEAFYFGKKEISDIRFNIYHENYSKINKLFPNIKFHGILFDLGTCSTHLDNPSRGFSFQHNGPLDMRMDTTQGISAAEWINTADEIDISTILYKFGEEKASRKIAHAIVNTRIKNSIKTTKDLVKIVESVLTRTGKIHPATKTFQAIRIHINNELEHLTVALEQASNLLHQNGVIVVISFHSLEDRVVKNFFKPNVQTLPKDIPVNNLVTEKFKCIGKKIRPSKDEINSNPRSRSAIMRAYAKI